MGLAMSCKAYSTSTLLFDLQRSSPILGLVIWVLELVVDHRKIEIELARELRRKWDCFWLNDHKAQESDGKKANRRRSPYCRH